MRSDFSSIFSKSDSLGEGNSVLTEHFRLSLIFSPICLVSGFWQIVDFFSFYDLDRKKKHWPEALPVWYTGAPLFAPGQLVHHKRYDYRGVVAASDVECRASQEWYQSNQTQPPLDQPWYHVLVDGAEHATYVAERHLESDDPRQPIAHPLIAELCGEFREGRYALRSTAQ